MSEMKANCFICNREVILGFCDFMNDEEKKDNPDASLMANVCAGYGSRHDGLYGKIYICDPCFGDRLDRVIDKGDYLEEASNHSAAIDDAVKIIQNEMNRLKHPSNKSFWDGIKRYWG
jgi:hypothetical protein